MLSPGAAPPDPIAVRLAGARAAGRRAPSHAGSFGSPRRRSPCCRRGLRPRTPSPSGSLALARPVVERRLTRAPSGARGGARRVVAGGCAPGPHRRPARWRSRGRSSSAVSRGLLRQPEEALAVLSPGAAPPDPIAVRLAGARAAGRRAPSHAGSFGSPRRRSPMMFFCTWVVPPAMRPPGAPSRSGGRRRRRASRRRPPGRPAARPTSKSSSVTPSFKSDPATDATGPCRWPSARYVRPADEQTP